MGKIVLPHFVPGEGFVCAAIMDNRGFQPPDSDGLTRDHAGRVLCAGGWEAVNDCFVSRGWVQWVQHSGTDVGPPRGFIPGWVIMWDKIAADCL